MNIERKIKEISLIILIINFTSIVFSQEKITYEKLFSGYIEKDRNYALSNIEYKASLLYYDKTALENGFSTEFSTGTVNFQKETNGSEISFSPEVVFKFPSWQNSKVSIVAPITISNSSSSSGAVKYDDVGLTVSADIVSPNKKKLEVTQLSAERSLFNAKHDYAKSIEQAEKRFLTELQTLFSEKKTLLETEEDFVDSQINFDSVKAKGYSTTSSKYRTSLLELQSNQLSYEQKKRSYETSLALFYDKCGIENTDFEIDIPNVELKKIDSFQKTDFVELTDALWTNSINSLSRASESSWSLTGEGGYGFSKDNTAAGSLLGKTDAEHKLKAGLNLSWNGLSVGIMFALPVNDAKNPSLSFSVGFNPSERKISLIDEQTNNLLEQKELLTIQDANSNYDSSVIENTEEYQTLNWQIKKNEEELALYTELEQDMKNWLENGVIANSEYRTAKINLENSKIQFQQTKILRRLYNINLNNLFYGSLDE